MVSRTAPFAKYPVRNCESPPGMTMRIGYSWHTFIHAIELKLANMSGINIMTILNVKNDPIF